MVPSTPAPARSAALEPVVRLMRVIAFAALLVGGAGSAVFTWRGGGAGTSAVLMVLFLGWVVLPFVALAWADGMSRAWPPLLRLVLYDVMLAVSVVSLACLGGWIPMPPGTAHAFVYLVVPAASWLLIVVAVVIPAWVVRRRAGGC